jgi:hypothetical protein
MLDTPLPVTYELLSQTLAKNIDIHRKEMKGELWIYIELDLLWDFFLEL